MPAIKSDNQKSVSSHDAEIIKDLEDVMKNWTGENGDQEILGKTFFRKWPELTADEERACQVIIENVKKMYDKEWIQELDITQKKDVAKALLSEELNRYFIRGMPIS
jgi:hypothetical protein